MLDISLLADLKDRRLAEEGICVGEGRFVVERMLSEGLEPLVIAAVPGMLEGLRKACPGSLPVQVLSQPEIGRIAGYPFHRGVLGAFRRPGYLSLRELLEEGSGPVLVLNGITDPVNLGGILRSAVAFSTDRILLGKNCGDPYSRRGIRASMAACFSLSLAAEDDCEETVRLLRSSAYRIICADLCPGAVSAGELFMDAETVLVLGNEGHGISETWRRACDAFVMIPISRQVDSLNVGVAAGILLYELARKKKSMV
ncbi:RNA methyltransferase [Marispirochaeta aestuarii]|uniref:TrmH family RNA methyltransferase n=1 Tax=Marispirochaeta aestuarii TaxID=1963862 RepID=UPI0029C97F00|nr:RNA methyltransferase [Marispirochaeta aestuarii]